MGGIVGAIVFRILRSLGVVDSSNIYTAPSAEPAPYAVLAKTSTGNLTDSDAEPSIITNDGASADIALSLQSSITVGIPFMAVVGVAHDLRINVPAGCVWWMGDGIGATSGYIISATIGSIVRFIRLDSTRFLVLGADGEWFMDEATP